MISNDRLRGMGSGVGLRPIHYPHIIEHRPDVAWFEVVTENFFPLGAFHGAGHSLSPRADRLESRALEVLTRVREHYPVALHGVSLSIGSVDPLNDGYLDLLRRLCEQLDPLWVSDHLCWTGVERENLHELLPLPFTREALEHIIPRVNQVQDLLKRPILLENVSSYVSFRHSEMTEWEFHAELAKRTGCGTLLDVNNVYVSSVNHGFDPRAYIDGVAGSGVGYFHLAGHTDLGTHLFDTHSGPVCDEVWKLFEHAVRRIGPAPALVEWDEEIPVFAELESLIRQADRIRAGVYSHEFEDSDTEQQPQQTSQPHSEPPSVAGGSPEVVQ